MCFAHVTLGDTSVEATRVRKKELLHGPRANLVQEHGRYNTEHEQIK